MEIILNIHVCKLGSKEQDNAIKTRIKTRKNAIEDAIKIKNAIEGAIENMIWTRLGRDYGLD